MYCDYCITSGKYFTMWVMLIAIWMVWNLRFCNSEESETLIRMDEELFNPLCKFRQQSVYVSVFGHKLGQKLDLMS